MRVNELESSVPTLDQVVHDHILHVLSLCGNHKTRTAQMLGIDRSTLWKKLREYGVEPAASAADGDHAPVS